jgi:predicted transcriptional regulator
MNVPALKAKMAFYGVSVKDLCERTGIGLSAFYRKISGKTEFTQGEISGIARTLKLSQEELCDIFFNAEVS